MSAMRAICVRTCRDDARHRPSSRPAESAAPRRRPLALTVIGPAVTGSPRDGEVITTSGAVSIVVLVVVFVAVAASPTIMMSRQRQLRSAFPGVAR